MPQQTRNNIRLCHRARFCKDIWQLHSSVSTNYVGFSVSVSSVSRVAHNWKIIWCCCHVFTCLTTCCCSVKSQTHALFARFLMPVLNHQERGVRSLNAINLLVRNCVLQTCQASSVGKTDKKDESHCWSKRKNNSKDSIFIFFPPQSSLSQSAMEAEWACLCSCKPRWARLAGTGGEKMERESDGGQERWWLWEESEGRGRTGERSLTTDQDQILIRQLGRVNREMFPDTAPLPLPSHV